MRCVIVIDLETTGLESHCEIISIGAIAVNWENGAELDEGRYEGHIVPRMGIPSEVTQVNGFTKENGLLYKNGEIVEDAVGPREGIGSFAEFLSNRAFRYIWDGSTFSHTMHIVLTGPSFTGISICSKITRLQNSCKGKSITEWLKCL